MDKRIGAKDFGAAMRAAKRLGSGRVAIVKACEAAEANSKKAKALLGEVPEELRGDLGYVLCRLHWLQVHDDFAAAAELLTETSRVGLERQDTDEWWRGAPPSGPQAHRSRRSADRVSVCARGVGPVQSLLPLRIPLHGRLEPAGKMKVPPGGLGVTRRD